MIQQLPQIEIDFHEGDFTPEECECIVDNLQVMLIRQVADILQQRQYRKTIEDGYRLHRMVGNAAMQKANPVTYQ